MKFIDIHRHSYTVESIVKELRKNNIKIAVSSYYAFKTRQPSPRALRDQRLAIRIDEVFTRNYSCYGVRKIWHELNRHHQDEFGPVARCTVERLMRQLGIRGVKRRSKRPSTRSAAAEACPLDLVERQFHQQGPNKLWVADITYVPTKMGWVYTAFVLDAYTREIVGWKVANHLKADLAVDALRMGLALRLRAGEDTRGLVHHSDRGVQYRAIKYGQALADSQVIASVGSRGDSYDNAMAEALNSLYKAELIDRCLWEGLMDVIKATSAWVGWYNNQRIHSQLGYRTPMETRREYWKIHQGKQAA